MSYEPCDAPTIQDEDNKNSTMTYYETIALLVVIIGWPVSAYFGHLWTLRSHRISREFAAKDAATKRRREYLAFLEKWRVEIFSPSNEKIGGFYDLSAATISAYQNKVASFKSQTVIVQDDFPARQRFDALAKRIAGLKDADWNEKQPRDVICEAIDALIKFIKDT